MASTRQQVITPIIVERFHWCICALILYNGCDYAFLFNMMTSSNGNIFPVTGHLWIHRSQVNSRTKGQWLGALMFSLICGWTSGWLNNRDAGDLKRHQAHYDVTVMGCSGLSAFRKSGSSVRHRVLYYSVSRICCMCWCMQGSLQWRHNEYDGVSKHQPHDCLLYSDQRKHQSSASLAFMRGIHRWPMNFPHKRPVTRKMFPFDNVIML